MSATDHTFDVNKFDGPVTNEQGVIVNDTGEKLVVSSPSAVMSKQQALIHAAWLVALADDSTNYEEFRKILRAVLGA
jgi:hypothetical protein